MYAQARALATDTTERLGIVTRECTVRVINFSPAGCLLETNSRVDVGTIASLTVVIDGRERLDPIRVVRCQPIAGAGSLYHVGAQFLWTAPPDSRTLRGTVIQRATEDVLPQTQPT